MGKGAGRIAFAAFATGLAWAPAMAQQSPDLSNIQPIKLTFQIHVAPTTNAGKAYTEYGRMIEERTQGKVTIEFFWSNSLFALNEALRATADGIADMALVSGGYFPGELPITGTFEHAFNASDLWVGQRATSRLQLESKALQQEYERNGVKWVAPFTSGTFQFFLPKASSWSTNSDFSGRSIRTSGGARAEWQKALGAEPIFMAITEVYEAAERGVIWGFENTLGLADDLKHNEIVGSVIHVNSGVVMGAATIMDLDRWNSLPEPIQKIILDTGIEWGETVQARSIIEAERSIQEKWEAQGIRFIAPSAEDLDQMRKLGREVASNAAVAADARAGSDNAARETLEELWRKVDEAEAERQANGYPWE